MNKFSFTKISAAVMALGLIFLPTLHAASGCNSDGRNSSAVQTVNGNAAVVNTGVSSDLSQNKAMVDEDDDDDDSDDNDDFDDDSDDSDDAVTVTKAQDDTAISKAINDKIGGGLLSSGYDRVTVQVKDGNVALSGNVKTASDKEAVEKDVRNIDGVKSVTSQINVDDQSTKADVKRDFSQDKFITSADDQLNKKIRDNVSRGYLWNSYKDVALNTNDGAVILTGSVAKASDQEKLVSEIQKVEGVKSVTSNLTLTDN